ncbi:hypothetical protein GXM_03585 [Nostoc sphaeroides CCNUC1]|uniref:Uncharacterized protein n=1 Tax=Nostoc sphaeroides CCNUC1 TaxID=2653204 RepID=A0A5P8W066_9NOSO|nr:hypothetical protein GXM_03585 [Nostoc sphaeroides CCNUC1]
MHGFADAFVLQAQKLLYPILPNYVVLKRVSSGKVGQAVANPAMGWGQITS